VISVAGLTLLNALIGSTDKVTEQLCWANDLPRPGSAVVRI